MPLDNKNFVITGSLENLARDEVKQVLENYGAKVTDSVSKKTEYVIVGLNPGSKLQQAKKLNIKILNEKEFLEFVESLKKHNHKIQE